MNRSIWVTQSSNRQPLQRRCPPGFALLWTQRHHHVLRSRSPLTRSHWWSKSSAEQCNNGAFNLINKVWIAQGLPMAVLRAAHFFLHTFHVWCLSGGSQCFHERQWKRAKDWSCTFDPRHTRTYTYPPTDLLTHLRTHPHICIDIYTLAQNCRCEFGCGVHPTCKNSNNFIDDMMNIYMNIHTNV